MFYTEMNDFTKHECDSIWVFSSGCDSPYAMLAKGMVNHNTNK
jgi:hypothetical protein